MVAFREINQENIRLALVVDEAACVYLPACATVLVGRYLHTCSFFNNVQKMATSH